MSYRRTYTGHIHYSGTVSYPASENGGTTSYSGSEPVYITIDVDTNSFDASIDQCNTAVGGLTTAVVATEAAQVESKRQASMKIANSIIKGFFDYVSADLSQKMQELSSQCESMFSALMSYSESCLSKRDQMQDDFNRITKRYAKIFEDLDHETVSRIEVLDRRTFQFADTAQKLVNRAVDSEVLGLATVSADENIRLETVLSCSHVKQQAGTLISKANDYLIGTYRLANSVKGMLTNESDEKDILLPVMYMESVSSSGAMDSRVIGTDRKFAPSGERISSNILSKFMSKNIRWGRMSDAELTKVQSYFNSDIQNDNIDDRVMKVMHDLMNSNEIQIIKA